MTADGNGACEIEVLTVIAIGFAAGVVSGLFGVGGGVLFVPALALIVGLSQVEAQATSLLAIVPVVLVGAWRQSTHGNVRLREGLWIGALAAPGALLAAAVANELSERALELMFSGLCLLIALRMVRHALRPEDLPVGPVG